jgi:hypothetical protein
MTIHVFKSTDTGAPTLSGTAGDLVNLLDKLLVDGYNSKTITITQSGGVATASCVSHGFNANQTIVVSGANESEYNIVVRIASVPDADSFTFPVDSGAASPATGTITAKVAPLGWTTAYTASNKRAYRQKAGTNQFYLRVVDDGTGAASYGRVRGFESMSDVDTGTGPFPTDVQMSGGLYAHKSSTANSTTRAWRCYSNGKLFHLIALFDGSEWATVLSFGDFTAVSPTDLFNTYIQGSNSSTSTTYDGAGFSGGAGFATSTTGSGFHYIARSYTGTGSSIPAFLGSWFAGSAGNMNAGSSILYPAPIYGGLIMDNPVILEATANTGFRGIVDGIWDSPHGLSAYTNDLDTFTGAAGSSIDGRSFEIVKQFRNSNSPMIYETSDTWGT